jgi:hypothetical protein
VLSLLDSTVRLTCVGCRTARTHWLNTFEFMDKLAENLVAHLKGEYAAHVPGSRSKL